MLSFGLNPPTTPMMSKEKVGVLDALISEISNCKDYRVAGRSDYTLTEIIFLTICATMSGCESYNEIEDFGRMRINFLRRYLKYENGIPSHDTINRVLSLLRPTEFGKLLTNWSRHDIELSDGSVIALDGKWLAKSATIKEQQTKKAKGGKHAVLMVNAYCVSLNQCLTSLCIEGKSGEKQAFEAIVELLDISNCIITTDAAGCYEDTVQSIQKNGADYVIGLKKNQPTLYGLTEELFAIHKGKTSPVKRDRGHGRVETRKCTTLSVKDITEANSELRLKLDKWKNLKSLVKIESTRKTLATEKEEDFTRYYISSLSISPTKMGKVVRDHWGVENGLHWTLDVVMGEDQSRKRLGNAAANYSIIRKLSLNHLKNFQEKNVSIKRKMKKCAMSADYLEEVLSANN